MTREEAITYLKVIWNRYKAEYEIERETLDAYHMAIEALSANATVAKIQIDDIDKAKTSSQLLDDLAVDMVNAMGKRIVEVVYCKDCRHRFYDKYNDCYMCDKHEYGESFEDNDFCSWGERREDGE